MSSVRLCSLLLFTLFANVSVLRRRVLVMVDRGFAGDGNEPDSGRGGPAVPMPKFPHIGGRTSNVTIQNDWSARAWVGTPDRLVQIQNEVEAAMERAYDDSLKYLTDDDDGRYEARELGQSLRLSVTASGNGGRLTRTGELSAIFAETDPSDIDTVQMKAGSSGPAFIDLAFEKKPSNGSIAVKLKVRGSDRPWVGGTHQLLSAEIAKGVPKWGVLRHGGIGALFGFFLALGIAGVILAAFSKHPEDDLGLALTMAAIFGPLVGGLMFHVLLMSLFPGFELVQPGTSPTGRRTLGLAFATINFAIGVVGVVLAVLAL